MTQATLLAATVGEVPGLAEYLPLGFWLAVLVSVASSILYLRARGRNAGDRTLATIASAHPDLMALVRADGSLGWVSAAMAARLGRDAGEMTGRPAEQMLPATLVSAMRGPRGWSPGPHEHKLTGPDARSFWVEARSRPVGDDVLLSLREITEAKLRETALARDRDESANRALYDPLTGLANRAALGPRLVREVEAARRKSRSLGVLHLDLCDFGGHAARHGAAAAEAALKSAAAVLKAASEPSAFLARVEGDQFVAILSGPENAALIERQANRLIDALTKPSAAPGHTAFDVAAGLALLQDDGGTGEPASLATRAALALAAQKRSGAPGVTRYGAGMQRAADSRASLSRQFAAAPSARQLAPWFVPRVSLTDDAPSGLRLIVRWHHPSHGLMTPDDLTAAGLSPNEIREAAASLCDDALGHLANWRDQGLEAGPLTVTMPGGGLQARAFLDRLELAMDRYALSPQDIVIALSEGAAKGPLGRITKAGFRVERRAFGPGAATLEDLTAPPTGFLRVRHGGDARVSAAIANLASSTGDETVVTGADDLRVLAQSGHNHAEGPAVAAPMPAEDVPAFLENGCSQSTPRLQAQSKR